MWGSAVLVVISILSAVFAIWFLSLCTPDPKVKMAVLGSGGHTGEMFSMLKPLRPKNWVLVCGDTDTLSIRRSDEVLPGNTVALVPRARRPGEGVLSSVRSSLRSLYHCCTVIREFRPSTIVCNGPGTCLILVLAAKLSIAQCRVVYAESLARVQKLSLTGRIIYKLGWADRFLVQWPELAARYPKTEYVGLLV